MKSFEFRPPPPSPPAKMHDGKHLFFCAKNLGVSTNNSLPVAI